MWNSNRLTIRNEGFSSSSCSSAEKGANIVSLRVVGRSWLTNILTDYRLTTCQPQYERLMHKMMILCDQGL